MLNTAAVKELENEKASLLAESELNRTSLQLDLAVFESTVSRTKETVQSGISVYPLIMGIGSLVGFLFLKKKKLGSATSLFGKAVGAWKMFQQAKSFLTAARGRGRHEKVSGS